MAKLYPIVITKANDGVEMVCMLQFPSDFTVTYDKVLIKLLQHEPFTSYFVIYFEEGVFNWQKFLRYYSICFCDEWSISI